MINGVAEDRPLSLYIHIPFCSRKCDYCAFYSIADSSRIEDYYDILIKELESVVEDWKKPFLSVYIGGGNPGIIGYEKIIRLLKLAFRYGKPEEVTVEFNPENIDSSIQILKGYVTRISVGIQSLNQNTLDILGRNADRNSAIRALSILSSSGFDYNADIITAVPGESIDDALNDIKQISSFSPSHISYYCLTFEEDTPLIKRLYPLSEEMQSEFLKRGWQLLADLGYEHYEVSAFSKKNKRSIHNQVYWNLDQYIGLGATAESSFGYNPVVSARNKETVEDFIEKPELDCYYLSKIEEEEEYIMLRLRVREGLDKKAYRNRFGYDFDARYNDQISLINPCWINNDEDHFAITEEGFLFLDRIILTLVMAI